MQKFLKPNLEKSLRFFLDIEASKIAILAKISRKTINNYLFRIREGIAKFCCENFHLSIIIEVDESYFVVRRVKEKRGRGVGGKTKVFGL